jgi:hypothetical protein
MDWLDEIANGFDDPAGVITEISAEEVEVGGEKAGKVTLSFRVRDLRGEPYVATANVYLPMALEGAEPSRLPVWFNCGYEVEEPTAVRHLRQGRAVVTSCTPPEGTVFPASNPLMRGPNTDYVLAHLIRGARFVDPTAIVYGGGSAGGYATLMAVAEAFPVAGAVALAPPVNLGYQAAYFQTVFPRYVADPPKGHPVIAMITAAFVEGFAPITAAYGDDLGGLAFFEHSPVAHVDRITCPAFVFISSADFLVPVEQLARELAAPTLASPPEHVTVAAEELHPSPRVAVRLLDVLGERADVRRVALPEGAVIEEVLDQTMQQPKLPVTVVTQASDGKQWLVNVLDEGPIVLGATHGLHAVEAEVDPFVQHVLARDIAVDQLTREKLEQLLDRYTGVEWLAAGYCHLDEPEAERADVLRGLRLYCSQSPEHAQRFAELYAALPSERQVLPEIVVVAADALGGSGG